MENINNHRLVKIINELINTINDNKEIIEKIAEKDNQLYKFDFNIDQLREILNSYKQRRIKDVPHSKILISHYGNPYISVMLCLEAIINHSEMTIAIEDFCYGLNKSMIKIINDILKEYRISMQIILENNLTNADIKKKGIDKIVCLGNSNSYMNIRDLKEKQVKYIPLFNILLYYDSDDYIELVDDIQEYAMQNFYEIQIFDEEEEFEDIIYMMNHDVNKYCSVLLSKDEEKQRIFRESVNAQIICINENPFKRFKMNLPSEIF